MSAAKNTAAIGGIGACIAVMVTTIVHAVNGGDISAELPIVITFVVTQLPTLFSTMGIGERVKKIEQQTNGTLTGLQKQNTELQESLVRLAALLPPDSADAINQSIRKGRHHAD